MLTEIREVPLSCLFGFSQINLGDDFEFSKLCKIPEVHPKIWRKSRVRNNSPFERLLLCVFASTLLDIKARCRNAIDITPLFVNISLLCDEIYSISQKSFQERRIMNATTSLSIPFSSTLEVLAGGVTRLHEAMHVGNNWKANRIANLFGKGGNSLVISQTCDLCNFKQFSSEAFQLLV